MRQLEKKKVEFVGVVSNFLKRERDGIILYCDIFFFSLFNIYIKKIMQTIV